MSVHVLQGIKQAAGNLNPDEIRKHIDRPLRLFLYAHAENDYRHMEDFFLPGELSPAKRDEEGGKIFRASEGLAPSAANDLEIYFQDSGASGANPPNVFAFYAGDPERTIREVLEHRPDLAIPLARHLLPFRGEVSRRIIKKI